MEKLAKERTNQFTKEDKQGNKYTYGKLPTPDMKMKTEVI